MIEAAVREQPVPAVYLTPAEALLRRIVRGFWLLYLLLSPFYFLPSGQPQFSDFILAGTAAILMVTVGFKVARSAIAITGRQALFLGYACLVDLVWSLATGRSDMLMYSAMYVFNVMALIVVATMASWDRLSFSRLTAVGAALSLLAQVLVVLFLPSRHPSRATAFFNNPNQLGYFAILYTSLVWVGIEGLVRPRWYQWLQLILAISACLFLTAETLSRAALASSGLLLLLMGGRRVRIGLVVIAGVLLALPWLESSRGIISSIEKYAGSRYMEADLEIQHRGYDRILNHPQYLLAGAGEGGYDRFESNHFGELHSTLGSILFCYGAIGSLLFLSVLSTAVGGAWRRLQFLLPSLAFGMTHNGLRQPEFWVLIFLVGTTAFSTDRPASSIDV